MTIIGYHASHEQFAPGELLDHARAAEQAGFGALGCSDHFHPWSVRQGHSGQAWAWLGAALASTGLSAGAVTCPFGRYHPAVVAQAAATLAQMFPGRFWIALGSGEALNEHITGAPWPAKAQRNAMLLESANVMRALWRGQEVSHDGHIRVDRARLYSLPDRPPLLVCAALTPETARWAGTWADGLITVSGPRERMRAVLDAFRESAPSSHPVFLQAKVAYADPSLGEEVARQGAFDQWRTNVFDSATAADLPTPEAFDAHAQRVAPADMDEAVRISCDHGRHAAWLAEDFDMGFDRVYVHNVGRNQRETIEMFGGKVLPALGASGAKPNP